MHDVNANDITLPRQLPRTLSITRANHANYPRSKKNASLNASLTSPSRGDHLTENSSLLTDSTTSNTTTVMGPSTVPLSIPSCNAIRIPSKGMFVISRENRRYNICGGDGSWYNSVENYQIGIVINTTPVNSLRYQNMYTPLTDIPGQPSAILQIAYLPLPSGIQSLLSTQSTLRQYAFSSTDSTQNLNLTASVRIDYVTYGVRLNEPKSKELVINAQKRTNSITSYSGSHIAVLDPWNNTYSSSPHHRMFRRPTTGSNSATDDDTENKLYNNQCNNLDHHDNVAYTVSNNISTIGCQQLKPSHIIDYNGFYMQPFYMYGKILPQDQLGANDKNGKEIHHPFTGSRIQTNPLYRVYVAIPDACHSYDVLPIWIPRLDLTNLPYRIAESSSAVFFTRIMEGISLPFTMNALSSLGKVWITCDFQDSDRHIQLKTSKRIRCRNPVWNISGCDCDNRNILDKLSVMEPGTERNAGITDMLNNYRKLVSIEKYEKTSRKCKCQTTWYIPHMEPLSRILVRLWYRPTGPGSLLMKQRVIGYSTLSLADILQNQQNIRDQLHNESSNQLHSESSTPSIVTCQIPSIFNNPSLSSSVSYLSAPSASSSISTSSTTKNARLKPQASSNLALAEGIVSILTRSNKPTFSDSSSLDKYSLAQNYNIDIGTESNYASYWLNEMENEYNAPFRLIRVSAGAQSGFPRGLPLASESKNGRLASPYANLYTDDDDNDITAASRLLSAFYSPNNIFTDDNCTYFNPFTNFTLGDALLFALHINHDNLIRQTKGKYRKIFDVKRSPSVYDSYSDMISALLTKTFNHECMGDTVSKSPYASASYTLDRSTGGSRNLSSNSSSTKTSSTMAQLLPIENPTIPNKDNKLITSDPTQPAYAPVLQHTVATIMANNVSENDLYPASDSMYKTTIPLVCPPSYRIGSSLNPLPYKKCSSVKISAPHNKIDLFQSSVRLQSITKSVSDATEQLTESLGSSFSSMPYTFTTVPSRTPSVSQSNGSTFHLQVQDPLMVDGWLSLHMLNSSMFTFSTTNHAPTGIHDPVVKNIEVWNTNPSQLMKIQPNEAIPAVRIQFRILTNEDLVIPVGKGSDRGLPLHWAAVTGAHSLVDTIIRRMDSSVIITPKVWKTHTNNDPTTTTDSQVHQSLSTASSTGLSSSISSTVPSYSRSKESSMVDSMNEFNRRTKLVDVRRADGLSVLDLACVGITSDHTRIVGRLESINNNSLRTLLTSSVTIKPVGPQTTTTSVNDAKDKSFSVTSAENEIPSRNTLHMAVLGGNRMIVTYILTKCPNLLEQYDANGHTPITLAALLGRHDLLRIMLGHIAGWVNYGLSPINSVYRSIWKDVNASGPFPLVRKPGNRWIFTNQWRIGPLPSVYNYNADGYTSLHIACASARSSMVSLFLQLGTSPHSPVLQSVTNSALPYREYFSPTALEYRINFDDLIQLGDTPLHIAIRGACKYFLAIEYIRSIGNLPVPENYTRLCKDYQECVILLCSMQSSTTVPNAKGDTPVHITAEYGFADLLSILLTSMDTYSPKKQTKKDTKQIKPITMDVTIIPKSSSFLSWLTNPGSITKPSDTVKSTVPINNPTLVHQPPINGNGESPIDLVRKLVKELIIGAQPSDTDKSIFRERKIAMYEKTQDVLQQIYGNPLTTMTVDHEVGGTVISKVDDAFEESVLIIDDEGDSIDGEFGTVSYTAEGEIIRREDTENTDFMSSASFFSTGMLLPPRSDSNLKHLESVSPPLPPPTASSSSSNGKLISPSMVSSIPSTPSVLSSVSSNNVAIPPHEPSLISRYSNLINTPSTSDILVYECGACTLRTPIFRAHDPGAFCYACHSFMPLRNLEGAWKNVASTVFGSNLLPIVPKQSPTISTLGGTGIGETNTASITVTETGEQEPEGEEEEVQNTPFMKKLLASCSLGYVPLSVNEVWKHRDLLIMATIEGATVAGLSSFLSRSQVLQELENTEYSLHATIQNLVQKHKMTPETVLTTAEESLSVSNIGATVVMQSAVSSESAKEMCMACLEELPLSSFYQLSPCGHRFCFACWKNYLLAVMDKGMDNLVSVPCMIGAEACSTVLTDADNENVWKLCCAPEIYSRYRRWMVQLYLRFQKNIQVCGNPITSGCGKFLMRMDADDDILLSYILHHADDDEGNSLAVQNEGTSLVSAVPNRKMDDQITSALAVLRSSDIRTVHTSTNDGFTRSASPYIRNHPLFEQYYHQLLSVHDNITDVRCDCGYLTCLSCGVEGHFPVSCTDIDRWRDLVADMTDGASLRLMTDNYKKCPKCGVYTQKNGGCKHMTCAACKYQYCFNCRALWTGYDHQCNKKANWKPMDAKEWNADALTKEEQLAKEGLQRSKIHNPVSDNNQQDSAYQRWRGRKIERFMQMLTVQTYHITVTKVGTQSTAQEIILQRLMSLTSPTLVTKIRDTLGPKTKYRYSAEELEKLSKTKKDNAIVKRSAYHSYRDSSTTTIGDSSLSGDKRDDPQNYIAILPFRNPMFGNEVMLMGKMYIETWKLFIYQLVMAQRTEPQAVSDILYKYCVEQVGVQNATKMALSIWSTIFNYHEEDTFFSNRAGNENSSVSLSQESNVAVLPSSSNEASKSFPIPNNASSSETSTTIYENSSLLSSASVLSDLPAWYHLISSRSLHTSLRSLASFIVPSSTNNPPLSSKELLAIALSMRVCTNVIGEHQVTTQPWFHCLTCAEECLYLQNRKNNLPPSRYYQHTSSSTSTGISYPHLYDMDYEHTNDENDTEDYISHTSTTSACTGCRNLYTKEMDSLLITPDMKKWTKDCKVPLPSHIGVCASCAFTCHRNHVLVYKGLQHQSCKCSKGFNSNLLPPTSQEINMLKALNVKENVQTIIPVHLRAVFGCIAYIPTVLLFYTYKMDSFLDSYKTTNLSFSLSKTVNDPYPVLFPSTAAEYTTGSVTTDEGAREMVRKTPSVIVSSSILRRNSSSSIRIQIDTILQMWDELYQYDCDRKQRWKDEHTIGLQMEKIRLKNNVSSTTTTVTIPPTVTTNSAYFLSTGNYRKECTIAMLTFLNASRILQWLYVHQMYTKLNSIQKNLQGKKNLSSSSIMHQQQQLSDLLLDEQIRALECRIDELFVITTNPVQANVSPELSPNPYFTQRVHDLTGACQQLCRAIFLRVREQKKREDAYYMNK